MQKRGGEIEIGGCIDRFGMLYFWYFVDLRWGQGQWWEWRCVDLFWRLAFGARGWKQIKNGHARGWVGVSKDKKGPGSDICF